MINLVKYNKSGTRAFGVKTEKKHIPGIVGTATFLTFYFGKYFRTFYWLNN